MKVRQAEDTVLIMGDSEQRKFSININDLRSITSLLIKQYSDIKGSIVRELTSNMYDSSDTPTTKHVIGMHENYLYFHDQGKGMSKEFMLNTYTVLGESTKRQDDTKIGAMGVGRLSALAYTNMYRVITVHEGIQSEYVVFMDNEILKINLTKEEETDNPSGTRVEIQMKNDTCQWENAIKAQTVYFPNLRVHTQSLNYTNEILENNIFVKSPNGKHELHICFGTVPYKIDWNQINDNYRWLYSIPVGIKIPLDAGIMPTPNREALIYDSITKKIVEERLTQVEEYIREKCRANYTTEQLFQINKSYISITFDGIPFNITKDILIRLGIDEEIFAQFKYAHLFPITKLSDSVLEQVLQYPKWGSNRRSFNANILVKQGTIVSRKMKEFIEKDNSTWCFWRIPADSTLLHVFDKIETKLPQVKEALTEYFSPLCTPWEEVEEDFELWKNAQKKPRKKTKPEQNEVHLNLIRHSRGYNSTKSYVLEPQSFSLDELTKNYHFIVYTLGEFPDRLFRPIRSIRAGKGILICKLNKPTLTFLQQHIANKMININDVQEKNALLKHIHKNVIAWKARTLIPNNNRAQEIVKSINPNLSLALTELEQINAKFTMPTDDIANAIIFSAETLGCIDRAIWDKVQYVEKFRGAFDSLFFIDFDYRNPNEQQFKFIKDHYYLKLLHKGFILEEIKAQEKEIIKIIPEETEEVEEQEFEITF